MSVLGDIMNKVLGRAPEPAGAGGPTITRGAATAPAARTTAPVGTQTVDVVVVLTAMAAKNPEKLDWRMSIVDLMKLLGLESGLSSRKELAKELGYTGNMNDSASMNIWLHKQVMQKLAANGGKVPDELR